MNRKSTFKCFKNSLLVKLRKYDMILEAVMLKFLLTSCNNSEYHHYTSIFLELFTKFWQFRKKKQVKICFVFFVFYVQSSDLCGLFKVRKLLGALSWAFSKPLFWVYPTRSIYNLVKKFLSFRNQTRVLLLVSRLRYTWTKALTFVIFSCSMLLVSQWDLKEKQFCN